MQKWGSNNSEAIRTPCVCQRDEQATSPCLIPVSASNPLKRPPSRSSTVPHSHLRIYNKLLNHSLCSANFILWIHDRITWRPLTRSELYVTPDLHPPEDHLKQKESSWNSRYITFLVSNLLMNWVFQEPWSQRVVLVCNLSHNSEPKEDVSLKLVWAT